MGALEKKTMPDGSLLRHDEDDYGELMERFLSAVDVGEESLVTYRWAMVRFFRWISSSNIRIGAMTPADILAYKTWLRSCGLSPLTVSLYLTVVRRFYSWAEVNMMYPNIARSVRPSRTSSGRKGFRKMHLTEEEAVRLLEYVRGRSLRDYAMVNLMLRTGLRTIEVSRADVGDIVRRKNRRILKVWGKGCDGKDAFVIINDPVWGPVREYLATRKISSKDEPLFVTEGKGHRNSRMSTRLVQHVCKEALRGIGLEGHGYSAHSLRHTTAVAILKRGGDWKDVQRVLRHVSPATSQIYTATIETEIRLERNPESILDDAFSSEGID